MLSHITASPRPNDPVWLQDDAYVISWLYNRISPEIFGLVHQRDATAAEVWAAISSIFLENREHQAVFLATATPPTPGVAAAPSPPTPLCTSTNTVMANPASADRTHTCVSTTASPSPNPDHVLCAYRLDKRLGFHAAAVAVATHLPPLSAPPP